MENSVHPLFRPPAEGGSLIVRVAEGCPHNQCAFCGMYKDVRYHVPDAEEIRRRIREEVRLWPDATRVFLADGDVMALGAQRLRDILLDLTALLPRLMRVSVYANGRSILACSEQELRELRACKLHTLYMGLESGDPKTLERMRKPDSVSDMVQAGKRAQACGLRMSVMVLLGLAGSERSAEHAHATADALNRMQPRLLAALRVIPTPNTELAREMVAGRFQMLSEHATVCELRSLVASLELKHCVFRANHTSNVVPIEARFPRDKSSLLDRLDELSASGRLDRDSPGPLPRFL
ncbi:MAG: radical SAM protein [Lentisphaeria bacterium]|nr:radical SAM protein [Lentisphaeria bacterium]